VRLGYGTHELGCALGMNAVETVLMLTSSARQLAADSAEAEALYRAAADVAVAFAAEIRRMADVELMVQLATALAERCMEPASAAHGSAVPWERLRALLGAHDGPSTNFELTAHAIDAMLAAQPSQQLPPWLFAMVLGGGGSGQGRSVGGSEHTAGEVTGGSAQPAAASAAPRNPALVCRVLLRHAHLDDALALAVEGMARARDERDRWVTPGLIDQLHAAASARLATGGVEAAERVKRLEEAARRYLLGAAA